MSIEAGCQIYTILIFPIKDYKSHWSDRIDVIREMYGHRAFRRMYAVKVMARIGRLQGEIQVSYTCSQKFARSFVSEQAFGLLESGSHTLLDRYSHV